MGNGTVGVTEGNDRRDRERTGNGERGGGRRRGGQRGAEDKRQPLVGNATEYQEFYGEEVSIIFGTYNIRNGHNGGLDSALRGMDQANMDLGIFQETKFTEGIYTCESARYQVVATDAPSRHRGRVALF